MVLTTNTDTRRRPIHLNRRVMTFLICLCISVFFWLLMTLSKEYSMTVRFPVEYINMPVDKVISNALPEAIDIEIRAKGFDLLAYKFRKTHQTVDVDMKDARSMNYKNVYFLLSNSRIDKMRMQFSKEIHIVKINPDTIFINFNRKVSKKVPVKYNVSLFFNKQFNLTDSVTIQPQYVTISADKEVISKIDTVETQLVTIKDLSNSTTVKLPLVRSPKHVELSHSFVNATINVTKYTEASLELPVEVENLPPGYSFKAFPDKVIVKFNVAFKNYEKMNAQSFRAVVDYNKIDKESNKLKVQLAKVPTGVRNVKLVTEKVEYIISK